MNIAVFRIRSGGKLLGVGGKLRGGGVEQPPETSGVWLASQLTRNIDPVLG